MSDVFDSRVSGRPGWGFPSCETALCRQPGNRRDPHGYYAEIGVDPWSSAEQIKARVRTLYHRLHPDTGSCPDPDRLIRVRLIAEVLLDPAQRERYNRTPPGKRLLDKVYRSELSALDWAGLDDDDLQELLRPVPDHPPAGFTPGLRYVYDWLSVGRSARDARQAQDWYQALLAAAPLVGYRRRIAVLLHDEPPFWRAGSDVLAVPRSWTPSPALAFALLVVVAGQRHPAWG